MPDLTSLIAERIQAVPQQRITFADYMNLALYEPQYGYYAASRPNLGPKGDFITSAHHGSDFGELLAIQFADMWQRSGQPEAFDLVEMGPGQGLIAAHVLSHLQQNYPECFAALKYTLVERSESLKAEQHKRLEPWQDKVQWTTLDAIEPNSIIGCAFSNELVDALPVHIIEVHNGELQEVYVTVNSDQTFQESLGALSTSRVLEHFEKLGIDLCSGQYPDGYRTEVNLAALDWLDAIANKLHQGYLLTIDYGYPAHRYYNPRRTGGTLQCYNQHRHHNDPYWAVGEQDITAHVDFTSLEKYGEQCGLKTLGFTQQAMFLMALGLGDRMANLSNVQAKNNQDLQQLLQKRDNLRQLIDPMGVGNFGVLIQSKGLSADMLEKPIKGLTIPPLQ